MSSKKPGPDKTFDCVVCGSCVVDLLCRPVHLDRPIGAGVLYESDPVILAGGGIASNSGITMARLGLSVAVFSYVGRDAWAPVVRNLYSEEGIDTQYITTHPTAPTSTTFVAIEESGERSFYHCVGAPKLMDRKAFLDHLDLFASARMMLLGYYSLMPNLEPDLPHVLARIRETGCKTAMDAAGSGGTMSPLDKILPHLDVWVPSYNEAEHQTGQKDPEKIIATYRNCGAPGLLGVKLGGTRGVVLSPAANQFIHIDSCKAPGPVIDTTGAGDSFYAGLLTGLINGLSVHDAGKLGAAAGACAVTAVGGYAGARSYEQTAAVAGLNTTTSATK
jgi:sugar/nucleoside kinase (ribokinase family)